MTGGGGRAYHGIHSPKAAPPEMADPDSLWNLVQRFTRWQQERGYSHHTCGFRDRSLRAFCGWAAERGVTRPQEITRPILERWQRHLFLFRQADGTPLSINTQIAHTQPLRAFFKWLSRENHILHNPSSDLVLPRRGRRLPRGVLTKDEVERVLALPNLRTPVGIRDRAILETLYSTGVRRQELINLSLRDLDMSRGVVMVREGKGKNDRTVPIGDRALAWIDKYVADVRPHHVAGADEGTLFLSAGGGPLKSNRLAELARGYLTAAGIDKKGACHIFRHTMATLMLENGADIRFIQAILGHAELSTTAIYTQVSIRNLKAVHTATHPARPLTSADRYQPTGAPGADDLLAALECEAAEEAEG